MSKVIAYTDGACSGNPGPGGWGLALRFFDDAGSMVRTVEHFGHEIDTTNNRMEMMAALMALKCVPRQSEIQIFSDSRYVIDGITKWIHAWKQKGWKTAAGKPVANVDLWYRLDMARQDYRVIWTWVKGHADTPGNQLADRLACKGRDEVKLKVGATA